MHGALRFMPHVRNFASPYPADLGATAITEAIAAAIAAEAEQRAAAIAAAIAAAAATRQMLSHFELSRSSVDNSIRFTMQGSNDGTDSHKDSPTRSRDPSHVGDADDDGPVRVIHTPAINWDYNITLSKGARVANTGLYRLSLGPGLGAPGLVTKLS
ncbi:hypothetical protein T492DRAFT_848847 [Pavlovales sp. CCMP2436]|nr:hypothetical protein T492DRAFT_848847 [Pavlovales sp. CCMP2436]